MGTVIGLGIFSIPYAGRLGGLWPGTILIVIVAVTMVFISLLFAEIIVFSKKEDRGLVFYAENYLSRWAGITVSCSIFIGYIGSLVAYILAITVFVGSLLGLGKDYFWPIILFFTAINSLILVRGFRSLGRLEFFFSISMIVAFVAIFFAGIPSWQPIKDDWSYFLLPYGVIWFALTGESAIPIVAGILGKEKNKIAPVIISAYTIIVILTLIFFVGAIKVGDGFLQPDPFLTMSLKMGDWVKYLGSTLSIVAVATSFWVSATFLKKILEEDISISKIASWALVIFLPLVLIIFGVHNFIKLIGLIGVFMGTVDSLIIIAVYNKIFRRKNTRSKVLPFKVPNFILGILSLLLIMAALSSLLIFD